MAIVRKPTTAQDGRPIQGVLSEAGEFNLIGKFESAKGKVNALKFNISEYCFNAYNDYYFPPEV